MKIIDAKFVMSNTDVNKCPDPDKPEYAFIGRSNVGKSSLINMLCGRKALAKTSATPGKTQLINHFVINNEWYMVDLPGYGFAKASEKERERWGKMIETYLNTSDMIRAVFLLVDIRHAPSANDKQMFEWMDYVGYDPIVIATKADKIKRSQLDKQIKILREGLGATKDTIIVPFSSQTKQGLDTIQDFLAQVIENEASLSDVEDLD